MKILTAEQIRKSEENAVKNGISLEELMVLAGEGAANEIMKRYDVANAEILIVCGNGNNGGDGFVMVNRLAAAGANVTLMMPLGLPATEISKNQFAKISHIPVQKDFEDRFDFIVDALFGIGLNRGIEGDLAELIDKINRSSAVKISVDVPSGVFSCGKVEGSAIKADLTLTMIAPKPCFFLPPASEYCGEVKVIDIKAEPTEYSCMTVEPPKSVKRPKNCHKGSFGKLLVVAGSYGMCGAEILASKAALRSGVGLVKAVVCDKNYTAFNVSVPEAVTVVAGTAKSGAALIENEKLDVLLSESDAVLVGCGLGRGREAEETVKYIILNAECPIVLDADGINAVCGDIELLRKIKSSLIITPHSGEMARLLGVRISDVESDRIGVALKVAEEYKCTVVLKGSNTVIASKDGEVFINTTGNSGLASAGSGDVLAGIIASRLARGFSSLDSAKDGVYIHGAAADKALLRVSEWAMTASDIIEELKTAE